MSWTVSEEWHARAKEALATVARIEVLAEQWEQDDEESLDTFGQHLMGGSVLVCAERLRATLPQPTVEDA